MSAVGSDPDVPVSELLFELPIQEMLYELTPPGLRIRQIEGLGLFSDSAHSEPDRSDPVLERARTAQERAQAGQCAGPVPAIIKLS